jgi:hypothetical protein
MKEVNQALTELETTTEENTQTAQKTAQESTQLEHKAIELNTIVSQLQVFLDGFAETPTSAPASKVQPETEIAPEIRAA